MPEGNLLYHDKLLVSYKPIKFDDRKIAFFKLMIIVVVFLHILGTLSTLTDRPFKNYVNFCKCQSPVDF